MVYTDAVICASCDRIIPDAGMICEFCNPPARPKGSDGYRELATTVRRLKGLVLGSLVLGIFLAPFAIWIATKALYAHAGSTTADPADLRKVAQLRRWATLLLMFYAFAIGAQIAVFT
jgi:hypothetical protein